MEARDPRQEPYRSAPRDLRNELVRPGEKLRALALSEESVRVTLEVPCHEVRVVLELGANALVHCQASRSGLGVAAVKADSKKPTLRELVLSASSIDTVELRGKHAFVVRICHRPVESCKDADAWKKLGDPFCLPVHYPGRICGGADRPECDDREIVARLPKDPCDRARFDSATRTELAEDLRILVDQTPPIPPSERIAPGATVAEECVAPGEPVPDVSMPVIDSLLLAALDPAVARILGLYHVDTPGPGSYDYKIVGTWPPGSLWHLPQSLTFDDVPGARRFLNVFPVGPLVFFTRTRPTIVDRPNRLLRTRRALAFLETDALDWNLPGPRLEANVGASIDFPEPVGEVQLYIGQNTPHVRVQAFDGHELVAEVMSRRRDDVLALHAEKQARRITRLVIFGHRFWLYRIAWGPDRIHHGTRCAFAYDLSVREAARLVPPTGVTASALPGIVQKQADCRPLREGATRDARYRVGVGWRLPDDQTADDDIPVRYDVLRLDRDDVAALATAEGPVVVRSPSDPESAYVPLPGWPPTRPLFTDPSLEPGSYRYSVISIDIFGRRSPPSDSSSRVTPVPPPPAPPTLIDVRVLDRNDPCLENRDRTALPNGVDAALRLRWLWSADAERAAPDAASFRVHMVPGIPNVLSATVESIGAGGLAPILRVSGAAAIPAQLIAGHQLVQGTRKFRILRHGAGVATGRTIRLTVTLRHPTPTSTATLRPGPCTLPLDALLPVEVRGAQPVGARIRVKVRTVFLDANPASGLVGSVLRLKGIGLRVVRIEAENPTSEYREWDVDCDVASGSTEDLPQILFPIFVPLALPAPPTPAYRDYRLSGNWPSHLGVDLPRTTSGLFDLLVLPARPGDGPGLRQDTPGEYKLVINELPADLAVARNNPRRQMTFGVSSIGADGQESAVGAPMNVTRFYRGALGDAAALENLSQPTDSIGTWPLVAGAPNFAGKSTFSFSWPAEPGWSYQVSRALDETLFAADEAVRSMMPAVDEVRGRFPTDADCMAFVNAYPQFLHADLLALVVNLTAVNRTAIEQHGNVDILLQALASLPGNDRAFTPLPLPADHLVISGNTVTCRDDTLNGRSQGRYFYRVKAFGEPSQSTDLGRSTRPVYVRKREMLPAPVWISCVGMSNGNRLKWRGNDPTVANYEILRANKAETAKTLRSIGNPIQVQAAGDTSLLRVESSSVLFEPEAGVQSILGVYRQTQLDPGRVPLTDQPTPNQYLDWNSQQRRISVKADLAAGESVAVVYLDRTGQVQLAQRADRLYEWTDLTAEPGETSYYRIRPQAPGKESVASTARSAVRSVPLVAPRPVVASAGAAVTVDWGAVAGVLEIQIQRSQFPEGSWTPVGAWRPSANRPLADDTVIVGRSYLYRTLVRYRDKISTVSAPSNALTVGP